MGRLLQWVLVSVLASASLTSGCSKDRPMKQLICRQTGPIHEKFDPCLCTHLVLHKDLHQLSSGDAKKAVIDYKAINPSLQVLGSWQPDGELDLDASQLAKRVNSLELDGVFLDSSSDSSIPSAKDKIINLVKVLASELDSLRSSKRAYEKYESNDKTSTSERKQDTGIIVQLPSQPQALGKHYDLKKLSKYVDYYVMATDNITDASENGLSYHPSRLMGIDDVLNADSLVDLVSGLGAPHEKLILTLPSSALTFTLANPDENMPRSKITGEIKKISQSELCSLMEEGGWMIERDEDLTAPYAYRNSSWVAFDDTTSAAIKGKYILLRDLAGAAMDSVQMEDWEGKCKETHGSVVKTLYETFTTIARKPRAAQLLALQEQIHDAYNIPFSDVQLSPYRIVRVVDRAGSIHVVRKEAKTEFTCSRQGYFTHPSGCNRFYRCVKFNQYSSDFTVFEYDCPAGLAFDERYEVCVWPGSLPDANACKGSSEIAPVPRSRYACPGDEGYYADPENCRWFFACLDHRRDGSELTAYEFRCPFGLVFNEKSLVCDWPWYVDGCGSGAGISSISSGFTAADILEGRLRPSFAQIPDHQVSGGRIENIAGGYVLGSSLNSGLQGIQGAGYYRGESSNINAGRLGVHGNLASGNVVGGSGGVNYHSGLGDGLTNEYVDNSGAYIHDPTGDNGGEYVHQEGPGSVYVADHGKGAAYVGSSTLGLKTSPGLGVTVGLSSDNGGAYVHDSSGDHGGDYAHQEGPGSAYVAHGNKGSTYITSSNLGVTTSPVLGVAVGQANIDAGGSYIHDTRGDHGGDYIHQSGPGSTYVAGLNKESVFVGPSTVGLKTSSVLGQTDSGAYVHDNTGDHGIGYIHQEGPGSAYIASSDRGSSYVGSSNIGLKTSPVLGVGIEQTNIGSDGAYIHDTTGLHGGSYVHQSGPGSAYVVGLNKQSVLTGPSTVGLKTSSIVGQTNIDTSGAYVHDSTGDHGGDYIHQEGPGSAYIASTDKGSSYVSSSNVGLKTTPVLGVGLEQANIGSAGAYIHGTTGLHGGDYVHQSGPGSAYVVGLNKQPVFTGPSTVGLKTSSIVGQTNIDTSGAYVHDSTGDHGGDYIHQEGPGSAYIASADKGSAYISSSNIGLKTSPVLGVNIDSSGTYIHDNGGLHGGSYVHQSGHGLGNVAGVSKQSVFVGPSTVGLKTSSVLEQTNIDAGGAYVHDTTGDHGGDYIHQEGPDGANALGVKGSIYTSSIHRGGQQGSGGYVHDTRGDYGGDYVHQEIRDGGYIHTGGNTINSGLNVGIKGIGVVQNQGVGYTRFSSGSGIGSNIGINVEGSDGQYIHDSTGDHGGDYTHQEGPQGPGYVQDNSGQYIAGLYSGKAVNQGNYYAGAFQEGAYVHDHSGAYVHDNSGDYVHQVSGNFAPALYSTGAFTVGKQSHYAGGFGNYHKTGLNVPVNTYSTSFIKSQQTGAYPGQYVSNVQPINYHGIGGAAIPSVHSSINGNYGVKASVPSQSFYTVSTPKPVTYHSTVGVPVSSTIHSGHNIYVNEPTATVSPIVVSSTPAVPLNPVQYSTISQKPLVSYSQVKPALPAYSVSTSSVPVISHSYKQPVNTFTVTGTPTVPVAGISVTTPLPPVSKISNVVPASVTYTQPQTVLQVNVVKTPVVPLSPVQYVKPVVTPAPAVFSSSYYEPSIRTQEQISYNEQPSFTYQKPSVINTNYHAINTPAPAVSSYTFGTKLQPAQFVKTVVEERPIQPVVVSSTPSTPIEPVKFVHTVRPIVISTPAPFKTHSESLAIANAPVNPIHYVQPAVPAPALKEFSYSYKSPTFVHSKVESAVKPVPKEVFSYSFNQPTLKTDYVQPISVSTPVVPLNPVQHVRPLEVTVPKVDYTYQQPAPVANTFGQRKQISFGSYQQPVVQTTLTEQKPLRVGYVSTPAPNVIQKVDSYYCTNCVSPSINIKPEKSSVLPVTVSTTPIVPLAPVQYQPLRPVTTFEEQKQEIYKTYVPSREYLPPVTSVVSTPAPPVVSYTYEEQKPIRPVSTFQEQRNDIYTYSKKPYAGPAYLPPVSTVVSTPAPPSVNYRIEQQPLKPLVFEQHSYANNVALPPVAPIAVSTPAPVFSYSYEQKPVRTDYVKPVTKSDAPYIPLNVDGEILYGRPVPVKGCTTCSSLTSDNVKPVPVYNKFESGYNSYTYQETPVKTTTNYQFQPGSYVQTEKRPVAPAYHYEQPSYQAPVIKQEYIPPKPCATCYNSQSASISVSSTPVVPLNTIQYVTTPAPVIKQTPIIPQVKVVQNIQPVVTNYEYQKPLVAVQKQKVFQETVKTPVRPIVNYEYQQAFEKIQPITVSSTPIVPLNNVQYVTKTTPFISTTPVPVTYTDSHYYDIKKVSQAPVAVVTNQPVTTIRPVSTVISGGYNHQQNSGYSLSRLSSPAPFKPQYTATVTQSPITVGVIRENPTPVFEEYFGIEKNNLGQVGVQQVDFSSKFEGNRRVPSVTYTTTVPTLKTVQYNNYESRIPLNQHKITVAPVTPESVKYTIRYKQPTTVVSQPINEVSHFETEDFDSSLNAHIDLAKINVDSREQYYIPTSTAIPSTVGVTVPQVKRVNLNGGQGYYVRKQKVRVRPVVTTTENYPSFFTSSYKPVVYSSTLDLTSPTLYTSTVRPIITSSVSSAELDVETSNEDDLKLVDEVSGNFGEVINVGNKGIIEQNVNSYGGLSSTTVASLKDGEAIVGVIKKTRVSVDGRKKTKVVVVSRLSDFNPILVGKLGAQCSCQNDPENVRRVAVKRVKGRLFNPQTTTADYLASTSQEYLSSRGTTLAPIHNSFESLEPVVEIKPLRKVQRIYSTTTALPLDGDYAASIDSSYVTQIPARGRTVGRKQTLSYQSSSEVNSIETETKVVASDGGTVDLVRGTIECQRAGLFRHPKRCNKFYSCNWDPWKKKFTLSVFNCPIHLAYDSNLGACNWPSKGPACSDDNLLV